MKGQGKGGKVKSSRSAGRGKAAKKAGKARSTGSEEVTTDAYGRVSFDSGMQTFSESVTAAEGGFIE